MKLDCLDAQMSSKRRSRKKQKKTPKPLGLLAKSEVERLVKNDDRWALLKAFTGRVPQGTRRFADVNGVGPIIDSCDMDDKTWDKIVELRSSTGQCKGLFFAFYRTKKTRRCESKALEGDNLCELCSKIRMSVGENGQLSCSLCPEYAVVNKALFARDDVKECLQWWDTTAATNRKHAKKLSKEYPFFKAQDIAQKIMLDSKVIFANGGLRGRTFKRTAIVSAAQAGFLRRVMSDVLIILKYENKNHFVK